MTWTEPQLAYLAGIVDGEGCVNIYRGGKRPRMDYAGRIYVVSTDRCLIDWLQGLFGGMTYTRRVREGYKPKHEWVVERRMTDAIISGILPYVVIKRDQLELLQRFNATFAKKDYWKLPPETRAYREWCFLELRRLNHRCG